jgi:hypothetical protein
VPFSKRKCGRGPLQRLSDQRRSLALAGLAFGAVLSATIFRRKRRGEEARFEPPAPSPEAPATAVQPETPAPAAPVDAGPAAAVEVPPAADEPELDDEAPINAAPAPAEPATGELSAQEASILSVLAQSGRSDDDRTAIAVATSLEREAADVAGVLRKLGAEGVVSGDLYTAGGEEIWAVTERGVRRLGAQN